ncbi:aldo/keto reductase [Streptomyces sioyaensis]|uniref:aldo/keto reductase n=1 Tax=Streptomyces sioyaensis TaxID=67364 RepID=UPI0037D79D6F
MTATLALGTYRCRGVAESAKAAVTTNVDWIDTAPNYQQGQAERQLAPFLATCPGMRVSTKAGFFTKARASEAVEAGVLTQEQADRGHSLEPAFLSWQTARSVEDLGRAADIVFLHNPETGHRTSKELEQDLLPAFEALELSCARGLTRGYGVATWSGLHDGLMTIDRLLALAHWAGGPRHHLRTIQLPLSLVQLSPLAEAVRGRGVLLDAQDAGLEVFASAPLHGGELMSIVTPGVAEQLVPGMTPLEAVLGTVASSPGVTRILLSASTPEHWAAAAAAVSRPITSPQLRRIVDAFSS